MLTWIKLIIKFAPIVFKVISGGKVIGKWFGKMGKNAGDWFAKKRKKKIDNIDDANDVTKHLNK